MRLLKRCFYSHQIELRGDILALPKPSLIKAIERGSSTNEEVVQLERKLSNMLGTEDCVWVPYEASRYTMGLMSLCPKGSRLIVGDKSYFTTRKSWSLYSSKIVYPEAVPNKPDGTMSIKALGAQVKDFKPEGYEGQTTLVLENSNRVCSGRVLSQGFVQRAREFCDKRENTVLYLNGERLLDSYVAQRRSNPEVTLSKLIKPFDAVTIFLARPTTWGAGFAVVGIPSVIENMRIYRDYISHYNPPPSSFPGCGLICLENFEEWYTEDHAKADFLASKLKLLGYTVNPYDTNILDVKLGSIDTEVLSLELRSYGVLARPLYEDTQWLRVVTHSDLTTDALKEAVEAFGKVAASLME